MRKILWAVFAVGVLMIAAPFAMGMPAKASGGQDMLDEFHPLMQQANVDETAAYYNDVFVPLGDVVVPSMTEENVVKFDEYLAGMEAMGADAAKLVPALAQALSMTEEQVQAFFGAQFPAMSQMLAGLPQMQQDFSALLGIMGDNVDIFQRVPAGLDHYEPLVATMQANVGNYDDANSLPSFNLFTWFFVVPGALLVALSGFGLYTSRGQQAAAARHSFPTLGRRVAHP